MTETTAPLTPEREQELRQQVAEQARTVRLRLGPNAVAMAQRGEPIILNLGEADALADAILPVVRDAMATERARALNEAADAIAGRRRANSSWGFPRVTAEQCEHLLRRMAAGTAHTTEETHVVADASDGANGLAAMFEGLERMISTSSRDWGEYRVDAWLWAVLVGWDCEDDHEHDETCDDGAAMQEMAKRHGWDGVAVAKARRYRTMVRTARESAE